VPFLVSQSYKKLDNIDTLLCACTWNAEVFGRDTGLKTMVIPYNLDHKDEHDHELLLSLNEIKGNNFAFCTVSQWGWRKGFDLLLKSYLLEFYDDEVVLFLRTYKNKAMLDTDETQFLTTYINQIRNSILIDSKPVENYKCKIVLLNSMMSEEQIYSVYKASNAYVTCTRGEGFGLPIAEFSLITANPVIAPNIGGHLDLVRIKELLIDSRYEPCYIPESINIMYSTEMNIIESSVNSARKRMREIYEMYNSDREHFQLLGQQINKDIQKHLDFDNNLKLFRQVLSLPVQG
jgi:glycosyltransferase involved in cell wall biosynthesis